MEWEIVRSGVKRKVFQAEGCTLVLNAIEPGHEPKPHSHVNEQVAYILQGEAEFTVGSKTSKLGSGSLLIVPPDKEHYINVTGTGTCINLDIFVPKREDYVQSKIRRSSQ
jgi:quercetin dioxygenase-like cupin family protein